ncbi:MAG: alkaline phosphatase family protein [Planctomycetota bacterium]|nr:alkaline phosphatase family protein [Planctomycetota bacterium]
MGLACASSGAAAPAEAERPRLVVVIAVDQMIPEQLTRLAPCFEGGLARLMDDGRSYSQAALSYFDTETGPGHATLGTGCLPRTHGVVSNSYLDRELGRWAYCVSDHGATALYDTGLATAAELKRKRHRVSAARLRVPALGEYLAEAFPGSRTVAISPKDRAAITLAGRAPGWALWWDKHGRGFVSSSAWGERLPAWVREWNRGDWEAVAGSLWEPLEGCKAADTGTAADERAGEAKLPSGRSTFPHPAPELGEQPDEKAWERLSRWIYQSPAADRFIVEMALAAIEGEGLGTDDAPDLLALSFSACDTVGHACGPYSREVTDVILRLDRELGRLFDALDERVGADGWLAVLSSDHGVLPLPENELVDGPPRRTSSDDHQAAIARIKQALDDEYGHDFKLKTSGYGVYLSSEKLREVEEAGGVAAGVRSVARDALLQARFASAAWTLDELSAAGTEEQMQETHRAFVLASFLPERAADVVWLPRSGYLHTMKTGTTHGTSHAYDRRIPLIFYGEPFVPGVVAGPADSMDAVPTLLKSLGLRVPPGLDGRVLSPR